jgi:selenocysteine-specific elongation factor
MIVATAGHIDHGKTLLVRTLTGIDTDRLPEEKKRGISIDLGFAYLPLEGGGLIAFVDVPGHERFVRNMLAGVCGIDFALLVIAADDGIMPQTREHLHILDMLEIGRGAIVITKIDRVASERVTALEREIAALLASTSLAPAPVLRVAATTGEGIAALLACLKTAAAATPLLHSSGQYFRFAVDRAFSVAGSGTVVTGTVFSGAVTRGDRLMVSPGGAEVRIRRIQIHGAEVERAAAGQRCALNLAGAGLEALRRGNWVLHPAIHAPTQVLEVRLRVRDTAEQELKHWMPVQFYLGTAEVPA